MRKLALPGHLTTKLDAVKNRLLKFQTFTTMFLGTCILGFSLLAVYVSDRVWDTPPVIRFVITITGFALVGIIAYMWLRSRIIHSKDPYKIIKRVQKHFPMLGDSLQGIAELAHENKRPENISEDLCIKCEI